MRKTTHREIAGAEEKRLVLAYQAGDQGAGVRLLDAHEPVWARYVDKALKRNLSPSVDRDDLLQEARIGFLKGVDRYRYPSKYALVSYGVEWVMAALQGAVAVGSPICVPRNTLAALSKGHTAGAHTAKELASGGFMTHKLAVSAIAARAQHVSFGTPVFGDASDVTIGDTLTSPIPGPEDEREDSERFDRICHAAIEILGAITEREKYVIWYRMMCEDEEFLSHQKIANRIGVSRPRARQIEILAEKKLKGRARRLFPSGRPSEVIG